MLKDWYANWKRRRQFKKLMKTLAKRPFPIEHRMLLGMKGRWRS